LQYRSDKVQCDRFDESNGLWKQKINTHGLFEAEVVRRKSVNKNNKNKK
jgi:hypothetical protein